MSGEWLVAEEKCWVIRSDVAVLATLGAAEDLGFAAGHPKQFAQRQAGGVDADESGELVALDGAVVRGFDSTAAIASFSF